MGKDTPEFVDIHCHILPGVDDGAEDRDMSLAMLRQAWDEGVRAAVLTPHYRNHYRKNVVQALTPAFDAFVQETKAALPDMELYLGCEVGYELDISEKLGDGTLCTLNNSRYVLLEFRHNCFRSRVLEGVLELVNFGYVPIIAHAERYEVFLNNPSLVDEVVDLGALIQINAASILGKHGFRTRWFCSRMLRTHRVHFIATDAHDLQNRPPLLKKCYELVRRRYGADYAGVLFSGNARTVLADGRDIRC